MSKRCSKEYFNKLQAVILILSFLPVVITLVLYGHLPEQIPTNFGFDGQVTYGARRNIWAIAGMAPLFGILFFVLPAMDPKRRNYMKFWDVYQIFQLFMQIFLLVTLLVILVETFRPGTVSVPTVISAMCGILFMAMGNMMPKFRQNFFCGFKNPWTLSNETVWNRTHRLGGRMFFAAGILGFAGAFLPNDYWKMGMLFGPVMLAAIVPSVMSYVWFRNMMKGQE